MNERKRLGLLATGLALLSAPVVIFWERSNGHGLAFSVAVALFAVAAFRGLMDQFFKHTMKAPSLFGVSDPLAREDDALYRRRIHFWGVFFKLTPLWLFLAWRGPHIMGYLTNPQYLQTLIMLPIFFLFNFLIFMGPMVAMGISQIRGFEPGDASWGVKLEDVRGQAEAKDEINKIITLWQSGEKFVEAGGKRERGILFLGPPGTGKTMLAKAIATGFNCPIVTIPGSGFAQMFMGLDIVIVRFMARKAKKLASKWGGQCIVFIDEIDAVGMRRSALLPGGRKQDQIAGGMGMMGMGGMAINQLLVVMDGIDSPGFFKRWTVSKFNTLLDASYLVPRRVKGHSLRMRPAKPSGNQIYFIGATNVALEALDPALTRAGRMGRHIYFREPTKKDRIDVFDLYLGKVKHDPEMDAPEAREEIARVTSGYSPADIEQVCSLALTYAHHSNREAFTRDDLLEAMVTLEAGTALGWGYENEKEELATAIHEAGHAVCSHLFMEGTESTRLSIKRRGATGGHHQAADTVERVFKFKSDLFHDLIWGLGAYAAELVFYGENTQGVGGDLGGISYMAGYMVGGWGMTPPYQVTPAQRKKLATLGKQLMVAARPGDVQLPKGMYEDEAVMVGQAFWIAYNTILVNKDATEKIAKTLVREKEIYGNDLLELLNGCELQMPNIDFDLETCYPTL